MTAPLITSVPSQTETLDERRWKVMIAKSYEGITGIAPFVIAVRTTGIFCRVGCPARTPHRHNVHFHDSTAGAVAAGYRACKRCHPDRGDLTLWRPKS
jgi:methylphosphotriester-DNA--protein-cysteine methyltransferase